MTISVRMKLLWLKVLITGCNIGLYFMYKCRAVIVKLIKWCDGKQQE